MNGHIYRKKEQQQIQNQNQVQMQQPQNMMANVLQQQMVQPAANMQIPGQVHPGAAGAAMTQQQQNAKNKKERKFIQEQTKYKKKIQKMRQKNLDKWQETIREERIQEGMDILEQEEMLLAEEITLKNQVVSNATPEQVREYGCASFRQVVTIEEAKKVVEESGGFLYYKEISPGLAELRPTLPEKIEIEVDKEKKEIPLRRTYNIVVSKLLQGVVDKKGQLLPDAVTDVDKFANAIRYIGTRDEQNYEKWFGENILIVLKRMELDNDTISYIGAYNKKAAEDGSADCFLPEEILNNMITAVKRISYLGEVTPAGIQKKLKDMKDIMEKENEKDNRNYITAEQLKQLKKLTPEQLKQLKAVQLMHEDAYNALQEMLKLRNLDPDSQEVPLPNACSANACFQERRRVLAGKNKETEILYETSSHTEKNLEQHIQYVIDNADWIAKRFEYNENTKNTMIKDMKDNLKKVRKLKEKAESGQELSEKEKEQMKKIVNEVNGITISNVAKSPGKYMYHKVGVVGVLGNGEDRITYTIETFAAEAKQYVVSPFTNNVAIGRYRGGDYEAAERKGVRKHKGVDAYYNLDNPLPDAEEQALVDMKEKLESGEHL